MPSHSFFDTIESKVNDWARLLPMAFCLKIKSKNHSSRVLTQLFEKWDLMNIQIRRRDLSSLLSPSFFWSIAFLLCWWHLWQKMKPIRFADPLACSSCLLSLFLSLSLLRLLSTNMSLSIIFLFGASSLVSYSLCFWHQTLVKRSVVVVVAEGDDSIWCSFASVSNAKFPYVYRRKSLTDLLQ